MCGEVETVDHVRKLKYTQSFSENLDVIGVPTIVRSTVRPYTKVTFRPDYKRFYGSDGLPEDMVKLLRKRVYDIAAITDRSVKVKLDGQPVAVKSFLQYIDLYGITVPGPRAGERALGVRCRGQSRRRVHARIVRERHLHEQGG